MSDERFGTAVPPVETRPITAMPPIIAVVIAFLSYNMSVGMSFGVYSSLVEAIQVRFSTSRALAATGLSVISLAIGLLSPFVGQMTNRLGLRVTMILGACLCGFGYLAVIFATNVEAFLACFALLIGPGICLLGPVPVTTLVGRQVSLDARGRAMGIATMPLFICIFPFVASWILKHDGFTAVFLLMATLMGILILPLLLVSGRPKSDTHGVGIAGAIPLKQLLLKPAFLVITSGSSIVSAAGLIMVTHLVPIGLDRGLTLSSASALVSGFGIAGVGGSFIFGILADRTSVKMAFAAMAFLPIPALLVIDHSQAFVPLLLCAGLLGLCTNAVIGLSGAAIGSWLGHGDLSRAMGMLFLLQVPFTFGAAPLAGFLVDRSGSYHSTLILASLALAVIGLLFFLYRPKPASAG